MRNLVVAALFPARYLAWHLDEPPVPASQPAALHISGVPGAVRRAG